MKKSFRPTPHRFQKSMQTITGNKTNALVRDLEEEEGELEQKTGIVISIEKDKINGNGWTVKDQDGKTYVCNCASNMYEVPSSNERGGILYPNSKIQCKFTVNPVLKVNTITEITGQDDKKIDVSKWTHQDQDTTVIAKPNAAVSISNGGISFNYDEYSKIDINHKGIDIKSDNITINEQSLDELISNIQPLPTFEPEQVKTDTYDGIRMTTNGNMVQATIYDGGIDLYSYERVIGNILDQSEAPIETQVFSIIVDGEDLTTANVRVYANGLITLQGNKEGNKEIHCTQNWLTSQVKNIIKVTVSSVCEYCPYHNINEAEYINYCPVCNRWHSLYLNKGNVQCKTCGTIFCGACGHNLSNVNDARKLKDYGTNYVIIDGDNCNYCKDILDTNKSKEFVNYCPTCGQWGKMIVDSVMSDDGFINQLYCKQCHTYYCGTCGTQQSNYQQQSYVDNNIIYNDYIKKMNKILYIKEN